MSVNNAESKEISEVDKNETPEKSMEMEEVEAHEDTACLTLVGKVAENINLIADTFNRLPATIIEIAVSDPKKYMTMLDASRKLTK